MLRRVIGVLIFVAVSIGLHIHDLYRDFFQDDLYFVGLGGWSIRKALLNFNPVDIHWFYRPVFVDYALFWNSIAPHNAHAQHVAAAVLSGVTAYVTARIAAVLAPRIFPEQPPSIAVVSGLLAGVTFLLTLPDETIFWACCASAVLSGLFSTIAIRLWLRGREGGRSVDTWASILFVGLALVSKEDALMLPFVLVAVDIVLFGGRLRERWRQWGGLGVVLFSYCVSAVVAYHHSTHWKFETNVGRSNDWHVVVAYVGQYITFASVPSLGMGGSVIAVFGVLALVVYRLRRYPLLNVLLLAALSTALIFPVASGVHGLAPRFAYTPDIYLSLLWAILAPRAVLSTNTVTRASAVALSTYTWGYLPSMDFVTMVSTRSVMIVMLVIFAWRVSRIRVVALLLILAQLPPLTAALAGVEIWRPALVWCAVAFACGPWLTKRRDGRLDSAALVYLAAGGLPIDTAIVAVVAALQGAEVKWRQRSTPREAESTA